MQTDPISDLLTRIRNAAVARHDTLRLPASTIKKSIAEILKAEGYIADVRTETWGEGNKKESLTIVMKYGRDREVPFVGVRRVSRPGRRVYVGHGHIPRVLSGLGVAILSTSSGLMTDRDARKRKLGGELLCEIW
jgi:small subunit ribosomal protein S8